MGNLISTNLNNSCLNNSYTTNSISTNSTLTNNSSCTNKIETSLSSSTNNINSYTTNNIKYHTLFYAVGLKEFSKLFWHEKSPNLKMTKAQKSGLSKIPNRRFILWWSPTINTSEVYVGYESQIDKTKINMYGKLPTLKISFIQIFRNNLWDKIKQSIMEDIMRMMSKYCECKGNELIGNFNKKKKMWIDVELRWGNYNKHDTYKYAKVKYYEKLTSIDDKDGIMIVFDLCYNTVGLYNSNILDCRLDNINRLDNSKKLDNSNRLDYCDYIKYLKDILNIILKNNTSLHILRERIRSALDLYTPEIETVVSSKEMYHSSLIVEDKILYNKNTLLILDPETGNLYIKKIEGNKNRDKKYKAGEIVLELSKILKKSNLLVRRDLYDGVESHMIEYKEINIKIYENRLNLERLIQKKNKNYNNDSKRFKNNNQDYNIVDSFIINLYKNWFGVNSFTKFCRLVLLIQAPEISQDISFDTILSDQEWIKIEKECKDFIINKYCNEKCINKYTLLSTDIRDIIFGFSDNREEIRYRRNTWEEKYLIMSDYLLQKKYTIKEEICTRDLSEICTNKKYNNKDNTEEEICNKKYNKEVSTIEKQTKYTYNNEDNNNIIPDEYIKIPRNLIKIFKRCTDINTISFTLLIKDTDVISMCFLPQFSSDVQVHSVDFISNKILGIIINTNIESIINSLVEKYKIQDPLIIKVTEEININKGNIKYIKEEGYIYTVEKWNYNMSIKEYDDKMKYKMELGIPGEFYSGYNFMEIFQDKES
ncbi:pre-mRNA-splicing factor 8 PRPF8 (PRP8) [Vairimorpha necatrix]